MRKRRIRRWLRRHRWAIVGGLFVAAVLVAAAASVSLLPRDAPSVATADQYADLFAHRQVRADVHGEAKPPSVLTHLVPPTPTPTPETFDAPIARILIPSIGVDAPVETLGLLPDGTMASPDGPTVVAWYGFTAKPGEGGNAVLSGHVDYIRYGPAVFWDLRKLVPGDDIDVRLADGTVLQYSVTATHLYPLDDVPMKEVLAPTAVDSITLITCGGTFGGGQYDHRLVLRAARTNVIRAS